MRTTTWTVICALAIAGATRARAEDPDFAKLHKYVFSSTQFEAQREADVRKALEANPRLANATDGTSTALGWTLDQIGVAGDLGRKAAKLAEWLVAKKANVEAPNKDGESLLVHYALFARVEAMAFLVKHGANVHAKDSDGRTSLHRVALLIEHADEKSGPQLIEKNLRAAKVLLDGKAQIDARDKNGKTPLALTAFLGNPKMTEFLLSKGADINAKDKDGYSVLAGVKMRGEKISIRGEAKRHYFTNEKERARLPPVIAILEKKGAKDIRGK
jgi:ankyrin repeat protein